ncbi:MAG: hypothetical protein WCF84_06780 [Anaerolineae bacterium]
MEKREPNPTEKPLIIRQVSQALALTGLFLLALAFLAFGETIRTQLDHTLSINLGCAYLVFIVGGGLGGAFHLLMARAFTNLDKVAYEWVRSTSWSPLVAIVTARGRRLDWPEVRQAFGFPDTPPTSEPLPPQS